MYEGEFANGEFSGFGRYILNNHVYYQGEWKDGKRHGTGSNIYLDGYEEIALWNQDHLVKIINKKKPPKSIMSDR